MSAYEQGSGAMTDRGKARTAYVLAGVAAVFAAGFIFWTGRTVYRHLLFSMPAPTTADIVVISISVIVLQAAYWCILVKAPPFRLPKNMLLSTVMLFCSRISFILAGALFSVVVLIRFESMDLRLRGFVLFPLVLFTIFCFARWLERLSRGMEPDPDRDRPDDRGR